VVSRFRRALKPFATLVQDNNDIAYLSVEIWSFLALLATYFVLPVHVFAALVTVGLAAIAVIDARYTRVFPLATMAIFFCTATVLMGGGVLQWALLGAVFLFGGILAMRAPLFRGLPPMDFVALLFLAAIALWIALPPLHQANITIADAGVGGACLLLLLARRRGHGSRRILPIAGACAAALAGIMLAALVLHGLALSGQGGGAAASTNVASHLRALGRVLPRFLAG